LDIYGDDYKLTLLMRDHRLIKKSFESGTDKNIDERSGSNLKEFSVVNYENMTLRNVS